MAASVALPRSTWALDRFEQAVAAVLYAWLVVRLWPSDFSPSEWYPLIILLSEGLVVALLVIRRRTDRISTALRDWFVAIGGTVLVLLVSKGGTPINGSMGASLMLFGLAVHVAAKLSLLRSFGLVAADRGIKVRGLYALVRHPMYLGYIVSHIGFLIVAPTLWNLAVYLAAWTLMIARVFAEERVLSANPDYRSYMTRVRYRFLPGVF